MKYFILMLHLGSEEKKRNVDVDSRKITQFNIFG